MSALAGSKTNLNFRCFLSTTILKPLFVYDVADVVDRKLFSVAGYFLPACLCFQPYLGSKILGTILAAVGAIAALVTECSISVERE